MVWTLTKADNLTPFVRRDVRIKIIQWAKLYLVGVRLFDVELHSLLLSDHEYWVVTDEHCRLFVCFGPSFACNVVVGIIMVVAKYGRCSHCPKRSTKHQTRQCHPLGLRSPNVPSCRTLTKCFSQ